MTRPERKTDFSQPKPPKKQRIIPRPDAEPAEVVKPEEVIGKVHDLSDDEVTRMLAEVDKERASRKNKEKLEEGLADLARERQQEQERKMLALYRDKRVKVEEADPGKLDDFHFGELTALCAYHHLEVGPMLGKGRYTCPLLVSEYSEEDTHFNPLIEALYLAGINEISRAEMKTIYDAHLALKGDHRLGLRQARRELLGGIEGVVEGDELA